MGNRFSFVFQFYRKPDVEITTVPGWLFAANYDAVFLFHNVMLQRLGPTRKRKA